MTIGEQILDLPPTTCTECKKQPMLTPVFVVSGTSASAPRSMLKMKGRAKNRDFLAPPKSMHFFARNLQHPSLPARYALPL